MKRDNIITIRTTKEVRDFVVNNAKEDNVPISEYLSLVLLALRHIDAELRKDKPVDVNWIYNRLAEVL